VGPASHVTHERSSPATSLEPAPRTRRLYERQGRVDEYTAMVARLKRERREYLSSFAGLDEAIVKSIG